MQLNVLARELEVNAWRECLQGSNAVRKRKTTVTHRPESEIHFDTGLEDIDASFRSMIGHVAVAIVETPFKVRVQIPIDSRHENSHAPAVDVFTVKIGIRKAANDFPCAPATVSIKKAMLWDHPGKATFAWIVGTAFACEKPTG